jgi:hypothetical protein
MLRRGFGGRQAEFLYKDRERGRLSLGMVTELLPSAFAQSYREKAIGEQIMAHRLVAPFKLYMNAGWCKADHQLLDVLSNH